MQEDDLKIVQKTYKNITIHDIAREANVSPVTVSRYFNSPELLKTTTRERINKTIKLHNYIPNMYASALTTKQTMTIGLIIPTVQSSIHAALIESIQELAQNSGYSILIGNTNYSCKTEINLLETFLKRRVSGIIYAGNKNKESFNMLKNAIAHQIPSVMVWENIDDEEIISIGINNYESGYMGTKYLIDLGHINIAMLIGPYKVMNRLEERLRGYKQCLLDHNLPIRDDYIISSAHSIKEGAEGFKQLITEHNDLTAIFAASDVLAFGALYQAKQEGISIPDDISIIGFDDIEFASFSDPTLTTIHVPGSEMGSLAVKEILYRINNTRKQSKHFTLKTEIVERQSTSSNHKN